jgi:hypothetical protein
MEVDLAQILDASGGAHLIQMEITIGNVMEIMMNFTCMAQDVEDCVHAIATLDLVQTVDHHQDQAVVQELAGAHLNVRMAQDLHLDLAVVLHQDHRQVQAVDHHLVLVV